MNFDKTFVYDERPGFETYSMMNMPYPSTSMMFPNNYYNNCSNLESRINKLENQIDNMQNRISRLESNIYPQAVDYNSYPKATYQSSMNIM